jgi:hypothetical protein
VSILRQARGGARHPKVRIVRMSGDDQIRDHAGRILADPPIRGNCDASRARCLRCGTGAVYGDGAR